MIIFEVSCTAFLMFLLFCDCCSLSLSITCTQSPTKTFSHTTNTKWTNATKNKILNPDLLLFLLLMWYVCQVIYQKSEKNLFNFKNFQRSRKIVLSKLVLRSIYVNLWKKFTKVHHANRRQHCNKMLENKSCFGVSL